MTRGDVTVRRAGVADLPWIADLVRSSFAPQVQPYLVAAQHGITAWWELVLAQPASFGDPAVLVAESAGGERLGYADLKALDDRTGFLSYVAVTPAARGRGVAAALLRHWMSDHPEVDAMELDVFGSNVAARRLYDRLGFEERAGSTWWTAPLRPPTARPAGRATVHDLHAVMARHRVYGFTDLTLDIDGTARRIGVMGDEVARVFAADDLADPAWVTTVLELFPEVSRVLAILPDGVRPPTSDAVPLLDSLRMRSTRIRHHLEHA